MIVQGQEIVAWAEEKNGYKYPESVGIGVVRNSEIIAAIIFDCWNGRNVQMHIQTDGKRNWCSRKLLRVLFDYAFDELKVKRITAPIGGGNLKIKRLIEGLGFKLEFEMIDGDRHGNLMIYVMRPDGCRWRTQNEQK